MKKIAIAACAAVLTLTLLSFRGIFSGSLRQPVTVSPAANRAPRVTVVIDDGERIATYSGIEARTAYAALSSVAASRRIPLSTKRYDFGVFVFSLGGRVSGADTAWIFFVNGVPGTVASDRETVQAGDVVQWRYMKPEE